MYDDVGAWNKVNVYRILSQIVGVVQIHRENSENFPQHMQLGIYKWNVTNNESDSVSFYFLLKFGKKSTSKMWYFAGSVCIKKKLINEQ